MKPLPDLNSPAHTQMTEESLRFTDAAMASEVTRLFKARTKASGAHGKAPCPAWKSVFDTPAESKLS